jgi:hypothetical protein
MGAQHTEGPWAISQKPYGVNIEPSIAWIGFGSAHSTAEHKANAALIAAAPDLLAILKELAETDISRTDDNLVKFLFIAIREKARKITAAAEGRVE